MPRCECEHGHKLHLVLKALGGGEAGCKYVWPDGDVCPCDRYRPRRAVSVRRSAPPARKARAKTMPKCSHCAHRHAHHFHLDPGCSRCAACPGYEPKRKTRSDKKPIGMKESDLGKAKRTLWAKFRAYVYRRDGNVCFTCDRVLTDEDIKAGKRQAGHMFPGRTGALLFDPLVVLVQCARCNKGLRGNTPEFVRRYVERFGIEQFQAAVARTSRDKQWRTHEVRELIAALNRDPSGAEYEALYMEKHGL